MRLQSFDPIKLKAPCGSSDLRPKNIEVYTEHNSNCKNKLFNVDMVANEVMVEDRHDISGLDQSFMISFICGGCRQIHELYLGYDSVYGTTEQQWVKPE